MRRLAIAIAAAALFALPAITLAADPSASPIPVASATPVATPVASATPVAIPLPSTHPVPITVTPGQLGALLAPVPVIATGPSDTGGVFRVDNPSTLDEQFILTVVDYTIDASGNVTSDANGNPTTDVPGYAYASSVWYSFPIADFVLPPGTGADMRFNLNVPPDALPGDHIAALIVTFKAVKTGPGSSGGVGLTTNGKILTRLQHRVAGAVPGVPDIGMHVNLDQSQPAGIHFVASINNTGTTVVDYKTGNSGDPLPQFRVFKAGSSDQVACFVVQGGFYVLPEGNRIVTYDWFSPNATPSATAPASPATSPTAAGSPGICPAAELPYTGSYRAEIWLPARDGREEITSSTTFDYVNIGRIAPPDYTWLYILAGVAALGIALLVILFFLLAGRRRRRREEAESTTRPQMPTRPKTNGR